MKIEYVLVVEKGTRAAGSFRRNRYPCKDYGKAREDLYRYLTDRPDGSAWIERREIGKWERLDLVDNQLQLL